MKERKKAKAGQVRAGNFEIFVPRMFENQRGLKIKRERAATSDDKKDVERKRRRGGGGKDENVKGN